MDTTNTEPEQQQAAPGSSKLRSTSEQPERNKSFETQLNPKEQPVTSSTSQADEQGDSAPSPEGQAEAGTAPAAHLSKVSFPRLNSSTPPTDGPFGVLSSNGQLVCEFKSDVFSKSPPPEEKIVESSSLHSEPKTLSGSVSPPPQASNQIEVARLSNPTENRTVGALEPSIDHDSYPEVYVPEDETGLCLPPRRTLPMDRGSLCTTSGDLSTKTGYLENNHMSMRNLSDVPLVTPIHLLGDQSDTVDCPFCMRRVETVVVKKASSKTHVWGTVCFFTTFFGTVVPYCYDWYNNIEHHCTNCERKIAHRRHDAKGFEPLGTHPELKEVSRFEAAEKLEKKR